MLDLAKVKRIREKAGLTLEQAAAGAGFGNAQQWYLIESGRRANVTLETLDKMARALGVKPGELLE